ncbi:MAG: hypothetical protein HUU20_27250 [Pirellulales bacterium]|nr:hypothetical protein [Pirellulales bacterium]
MESPRSPPKGLAQTPRAEVRVTLTAGSGLQIVEGQELVFQGGADPAATQLVRVRGNGQLADFNGQASRTVNVDWTVQSDRYTEGKGDPVPIEVIDDRDARLVFMPMPKKNDAGQGPVQREPKVLATTSGQRRRFKIVATQRPAANLKAFVSLTVRAGKTGVCPAQFADNSALNIQAQLTDNHFEEGTEIEMIGGPDSGNYEIDYRVNDKAPSDADPKFNTAGEEVGLFGENTAGSGAEQLAIEVDPGEGLAVNKAPPQPVKVRLQPAPSGKVKINVTQTGGISLDTTALNFDPTTLEPLAAAGFQTHCKDRAGRNPGGA